jgi:hypothetical protein
LLGWQSVGRGVEAAKRDIKARSLCVGEQRLWDFVQWCLGRGADTHGVKMPSG